MNDNSNEYGLKFKYYSYNKDNDILYIRGISNNYEILENCDNDDNQKEITCNISKGKLESIIISNTNTISLGAMNDNIGAISFNFVSPINIKYEISKKTDINVVIKNLLNDKAASGATFAYETTSRTIPALETTIFTLPFSNMKYGLQCYLKKTEKTKLLLLCTSYQEGEIYLALTEEYIYLEQIHPKYNFIILSEVNDKKVTIKGSGASIYLVYPNTLDLTSGKSLTIRYVYDSTKTSLTNIKLNPDSNIYLQCEDLMDMKKCIVPLSHFEDKATGDFPTNYYVDSLNAYSAFYEINSIAITLPSLATLKIENKDNVNSIKVGQKGIIYLVTDYIDKEDKFPEISLDKLSFVGNFIDINDNTNITKSICKLWKLTHNNIRLICQLNKNFNKEKLTVYLEQTSFMIDGANNEKLGVIVSYRADNIKVKQLNTEMSFLYSEQQEINIIDDKDTYNLIFNQLYRDNRALFLYSNQIKSIILDNCKSENNKLLCTVNKEKLLEILSKSGEVFSVGEKYDNDGIYKFNSVLDIKFNYEVKKEDIKIKIGKLLTNIVSKNEFIAYETNIDNTKAFTTDYFEIETEESNGKNEMLI